MDGSESRESEEGRGGSERKEMEIEVTRRKNRNQAE
jgi:hypothetical protein